MTSDEILTIASELNCKPESTALTFARTIAEHCALLAEKLPKGTTARDVAASIRTEFRLKS